MYTGSVFNYLGSVAMALAYISLFMLFSKSGAMQKLKEALRAVGRMAFTNYILQSVICTLIFDGYGLGLFGSVERWGQLLITIAVWILLLLLSPLWLGRFRQGPLEWSWRRLTYGANFS